MASPQEIVDLLNLALAYDPNAIHALCSAHVKCNSLLAKATPIRCPPMPGGETVFAVGMLGFLNALCLMDELRIEAVLDETDPCQRVKEFRLLPVAFSRSNNG